MQLAKIAPLTDDGHVNVVVETTAGSRCKYKWEEAPGAMRLSNVLPTGMTFPYDFGFVPNTRAEDGDPLDALVLADEPLACGSYVECRVLGVLEIETSDQARPDAPRTRNDRLIVVPVKAIAGAAWKSLEDLGELLDGIEAFFRTYVEREGRSYRLVGKSGHRAAMHAIKRAMHGAT